MSDNLMAMSPIINEAPEIMKKIISYSYQCESRINAKKTKWAWDQSEYSQTVYTNFYTTNFNDYLGKYPTLFNNLYLKFDLNGSQVDIYDQRKDPFANHNDDYNKLFFADFQYDSNIREKKLGEATSQKDNDGERAIYSIKYKYNYDQKLFIFQIKM